MLSTVPTYIRTYYLTTWAKDTCCLASRRPVTLHRDPSATHLLLVVVRAYAQMPHTAVCTPCTWILVYVHTRTAAELARMALYQPSCKCLRQCPATKSLLRRHAEQDTCTTHYELPVGACRYFLGATVHIICRFEAKPPLTAAPAHSSYSASLHASTAGWSGCTSLSGSTLV